MATKKAFKKEKNIMKCPKCNGEMEVFPTNVEIENVPAGIAGIVNLSAEAHRCSICGFVELYAKYIQ